MNGITGLSAYLFIVLILMNGLAYSAPKSSATLIKVKTSDETQIKPLLTELNHPVMADFSIISHVSNIGSHERPVDNTVNIQTINSLIVNKTLY